MEARLSVLSKDPVALWNLVSIHIRCSPKTGESDHQLTMNRMQMFDLYRIGERSMVVEEAVCRKANKELKEKKEKDELILKKSKGGDDMAMTNNNLTRWQDLWTLWTASVVLAEIGMISMVSQRC